MIWARQHRQTSQPAGAGFFGKIPARGDFVGAGLPRSVTDVLDAWLRQVLAGSRERLGEAWLAAWLEAPIWRFALPAGVCGPAALLGAWMPSVDRVGRQYPLVLAAMLRGQDPEGLRQRGAAWLEGAVVAGLAAVEEDLGPDALAERLAALKLPEPEPASVPSLPGPGLWWTDGAPFVPAAELHLAGLPGAACFARMISAGPVRHTPAMEERSP